MMFECMCVRCVASRPYRADRRSQPIGGDHLVHGVEVLPVARLVEAGGGLAEAAGRAVADA